MMSFDLVAPPVAGRWLAALALGCLALGEARGDALMRTEAMSAPTIAEIEVRDDRIRVELEIGITDLRAFANVLPDELHRRLFEETPPLAERFPRFVREDWVVTADERTLLPTIESIEGRARVVRDVITGEPLPIPEDAEPEPVVSVVLVYENTDRPKVLTVSPPARTPDRPAAGIGFVLQHEGLAVNDFRYLGQPETVDLDWSDPWYSRFRNRNLRRQYDQPAQAFLYVEPFEVRSEIVVRPRDLEAWIDLGLDSSGNLDSGQRAAILEKAAGFLGDHCPVTVDGRPVDLALDRIHFIRRSLRRTSVVAPEEEPIPAVSAVIGAIFTAPLEGLPSTATLRWDLFNDRIRSVSSASVDEAGPLPWTITPEDPELVWKNFLTNPTVPGTLAQLPPPPAAPAISLPLATAAGILAAACLAWAALRAATPSRRWVLGGGALAMFAASWTATRVAVVAIPLPGARGPAPEPEAAARLVEGLLGNVYRAFDLRDEDRIYDTLARSVGQELLDRVYTEVYQSLVLSEQGGARIKVTEVAVSKADPTSAPPTAAPTDALVLDCRWDVTGQVGHWGHVHTRRNRYGATLVLAPDHEAAAWRLVALDDVASERVE